MMDFLSMTSYPGSSKLGEKAPPLSALDTLPLAKRKGDSGCP